MMKLWRITVEVARKSAPPTAYDILLWSPDPISAQAAATKAVQGKFVRGDESIEWVSIPLEVTVPRNTKIVSIEELHG